VSSYDSGEGPASGREDGCAREADWHEGEMTVRAAKGSSKGERMVNLESPWRSDDGGRAARSRQAQR
jgi:hypothetical protein